MADPRLASSALTNLSRVVVTLVSVWLIGGTFAALTHPAAKRKQLQYERQMQLKQARMEAAKRDLRVDRHLDAAYLAYDHLQFARAEREFRSAVKLRRDARTVRDLARFLSICCDPSIRDADEAVDLAHEAVRLEFDPGWRAKLTLADAYAIAGEYEQAVITQEEAIAVYLETRTRSRNHKYRMRYLNLRLENYQNQQLPPFWFPPRHMRHRYLAASTVGLSGMLTVRTD